MQTTFAKYISKIKTIGTIEIAKPIFIVEGTEKTKINEINNIGFYEFKVKNYDDTQISETDFLYTIEIMSDICENVKFELYNEDKPIPLKNQKTDTLYISGNVKTEQNYKLKVTYDKKLGNNGKNILEEVQVKVHAEQG